VDVYGVYSGSHRIPLSDDSPLDHLLLDTVTGPHLKKSGLPPLGKSLDFHPILGHLVPSSLSTFKKIFDFWVEVTLGFFATPNSENEEGI
jgi:hypothetical protein